MKVQRLQRKLLEPLRNIKGTLSGAYEWREIEALELGNKKIDELRKEINNINIQMIKFSLLEETRAGAVVKGGKAMDVKVYVKEITRVISV